MGFTSTSPLDGARLDPCALILSTSTWGLLSAGVPSGTPENSIYIYMGFTVGETGDIVSLVILSTSTWGLLTPLNSHMSAITFYLHLHGVYIAALIGVKVGHILSTSTWGLHRICRKYGVRSHSIYIYMGFTLFRKATCKPTDNDGARTMPAVATRTAAQRQSRIRTH